MESERGIALSHDYVAMDVERVMIQENNARNGGGTVGRSPPAPPEEQALMLEVLPALVDLRAMSCWPSTSYTGIASSVPGMMCQTFNS